MIEFNNVYKTYRIAQSRSGFGGSVKSLFFPKYRYIRAIDDLTFNIKEGELVGLIGENGAGKSTLVKMATGILRPDRGCVLFNGLEVNSHRKKCAFKFGVVFGQRRSLWWQLSAKEGFEALGRIYKINSKEVNSRIAQLINLFELKEFVNRPIRQLSLGQRVRCEVTSCFIHRPKMVFLDEPTIGMDSLAKIKMREYLKRINQEECVAVLLTSHDLFDVERVCKRIMILDKGNLILDGSLDSIRKKYGSKRQLNLNLASPLDNVYLKDINGIESVTADDKWKLKIHFDPLKKTALELISELQKSLDIADFTIEDLPIDEFVAEIYKGQK